MPCFVDTSAWFALFDKKLTDHRRITSAYSSLLNAGTPLTTSTHVMGELYTLALSRFGIPGSAFWEFFDSCRLSPSITVVHLASADIDKVWQLLMDRPDKTYSFVDATSFIFMRRSGIASALTLDRHFVQEGFRVLPEGALWIHDPGADFQGKS